MSVKELSEALNKQGLLTEGELSFPVIVEDVKMAYGQARYLVAPVGGVGRVWVNNNRVKLG